MGLIEELQNLSDTIKEYSDQDLDEANTEIFCFEPFIELLGFQRTLTDMQRQYPADIRGGGRTVDYAIKKDGAPIMIVECKPLGDNLDAHIGQLGEYFTAVRETRFGILTDGRLYRFYTDIDAQNLMDSNPFLEIDLLDIQPPLVAELERFTKSRFNVDQARATAHNLKDSKAIQHFLIGQLESPTGDFVSYVASAVDISIDTPERRQQITEIIHQTLKAFRGEETDPLSPSSLLDSESEPATELNESQTWIKKKIRAFTFNGELYEVKHWNEFLAKFCGILSEDDAIQFEDVLELKPHSFSKNPAVGFPKSANPKQIGETDIYVQTNINNNVKYEIVKDLVEHFGCNMPVLHIDEN